MAARRPTLLAAVRDLSKTKVNRAGDVMRVALDDPSAVTAPEVVQAAQVIVEHRRLHADPMRKVAVGLRYFVSKHSSARPITVGQRLKRLRTILLKLRREPEMRLARMHDIGGCRAVVQSEDEVRAIADDIRRQRRWKVVREYDYIAQPKLVSGYRAFHLVIERDDRLIEVQLRTVRQHQWAELIEVVDRRNPDIDLKGGEAPADLVEYYRLGAVLLADDERGDPPDVAIIREFRRLHDQVAPYTVPKRTDPK